MGTAISRDFAACCLEKISCEEEVNNESQKISYKLISVRNLR